MISQPSLSIFVGLTNSTGQTPNEFTSNQTMYVTANIFYGPFTVTSGIFTAKVVTLTGTSLVTNMTYDSSTQAWNCSIIVPQQSGVAYVDVNGTSNGSFGGRLCTNISRLPRNLHQSSSHRPMDHSARIASSHNFNGPQWQLRPNKLHNNASQLIPNPNQFLRNRGCHQLNSNKHFGTD